jgi:hypothetical protein
MKLNLKQMDIVFIVVVVLFCILLSIYYYFRKIESFQCIQFDVVGQGSLDKSIEMDYGKVQLSSTNNYVRFNKTFQTVPLVFTQVIGEGEQVSMVNLSQITKEGFAYHVHSIYNQKIPLDKEDIDEENPKNNRPIERILFEKDKVNGFYWLAFVKNDTKMPILAEEEALPKQKDVSNHLACASKKSRTVRRFWF